MKIRNRSGLGTRVTLALAGITLAARGWTTNIMATETDTRTWLGSDKAVTVKRDDARLGEAIRGIMERAWRAVEEDPSKIITLLMKVTATSRGTANREAKIQEIMREVSETERSYRIDKQEYGFVKAFILDVLAGIQSLLLSDSTEKDKERAEVIEETRLMVLGDQSVNVRWNGDAGRIRGLIATQESAGYIKAQMTRDEDGMEHVRRIGESGGYGELKRLHGEIVLWLAGKAGKEVGTKNPDNVLSAFGKGGNFAAIRNDYGDVREFEIMGGEGGPEMVLESFVPDRNRSRTPRTQKEAVGVLREAITRTITKYPDRSEAYAKLEEEAKNDRWRLETFKDLRDGVEQSLEGDLNTFEHTVRYRTGNPLNAWLRTVPGTNDVNDCQTALEATLGLGGSIPQRGTEQWTKATEDITGLVRRMPWLSGALKAIQSVFEEFGNNKAEGRSGEETETTINAKYGTLKCAAWALGGLAAGTTNKNDMIFRMGKLAALRSAKDQSELSKWGRSVPMPDDAAEFIRALMLDIEGLRAEADIAAVPARRITIDLRNGWWKDNDKQRKLTELYDRRDELKEVDAEFVTTVYEEAVEGRTTGRTEQLAQRDSGIVGMFRKAIAEGVRRKGLIGNINDALEYELDLIAATLPPIGRTSEWRHVQSGTDKLRLAARYVKAQLGAGFRMQPTEVWKAIGGTSHAKLYERVRAALEEGAAESEKEMMELARRAMLPHNQGEPGTAGEWYTYLRAWLETFLVTDESHSYFEAARQIFLQAGNEIARQEKPEDPDWREAKELRTAIPREMWERVNIAMYTVRNDSKGNRDDDMQSKPGIIDNMKRVAEMVLNGQSDKYIVKGQIAILRWWAGSDKYDLEIILEWLKWSKRTTDRKAATLSERARELERETLRLTETDITLQIKQLKLFGRYVREEKTMMTNAVRDQWNAPWRQIEDDLTFFGGSD